MGAETDMRSSHAVFPGSAPKTRVTSSLTQGDVVNNSEFPVGLRVLVVDDDPIVLLILDRMLRQCLYKVTTCERAADALKKLRENKDGYDLVISDVHMPDMDGFKLLELVGLEMDLPVIMMSANGETSAVMKGIKHGACDYLLKPVRIEELRNIWQHVVRKKRRGPEFSDNNDMHQHDDGSENHASDGPDGALKHSKKRKDTKEEEEDTELENEDPATAKKPRVVWSVELHQKFVSAVNQLGLDTVPKRILELMDVRGLTRENVASHLQKYRLYLKRISGVAHQAGGLSSAFLGITDANFGGSRGGLVDMQGQLSPQAFVSALQTGLHDRMGPNHPLGVDSFSLRQIPYHSTNNDANVRSSIGPRLVNRPIGGSPLSTGLDFKHLSQGLGQMTPLNQPDKGSVGLSALQEYCGVSGMEGVRQFCGIDNTLAADDSNNPLIMQILHQQASSQSLNAGQLQPSGDFGVTIPKVTGFNTGMGIGASPYIRMGQESPISSSGFELAPYRRAVPVDSKGYNICRPDAYNNLASCHGTDDGTTAICDRERLSEQGELLSQGTPQGTQGLSCDSAALQAGNLTAGLNAVPNSWQGWHSLALNQSLSRQSGGSTLSLDYMQGLASNHAMKPGCVQEQGLSWASGLQDRVVADTAAKPLCTANASLNEACTGESESKFKDPHPPFEFFLDAKVESGMTPESVPSDDLLMSFFKQVNN